MAPSDKDTRTGKLWYNKNMLLALFASITVLTNLSDVASAVSADDTNANFDVIGSVITVCRSKSALFVLQTAGECTTFRDNTTNRQSLSFQPGNIIRAKGRISTNEYDYPAANCSQLEFLEKGTPPRVITASATDLTNKSLNGKLIRAHGVVKETFRDEIDPKYVYLTLDNQGFSFTVSICDDIEHGPFLDSLVDAEISISGVYLCVENGLRKLANWTLSTYTTNSICILKPAPADPFGVATLSDTELSSPSEVASLGKRKISGRVTAVRQDKDFLIKDKGGTTRRVKPRNAECPSYGDIIEAVGYPETDLYRLNLSDALWRKTGESTKLPEPPVNTDVSHILTDGKGHLKINPLFHGKAIRIVGNVIDIPSGTRRIEAITLKCGKFSIPVDISANPSIAAALAIGCQLSVAGTCMVETDSWRPYSTFPHATGITLAVRRPDDVTIISQPPWWTPAKLMLVISSLLLVLITFIIWNRVLNKLVTKRSRALAKEQVALAEAELKISERTRLAIELHDSLSQNLAAVAFQIVATKGAATVSPDETIDNLNAAERMLLSCRTELKRCLWDLRNDTLDIRNMTDVIQMVLAPVKGNATLNIRFNVARSQLDDSMLHAVSCIIRELVSNAIQHGKATHVNVAGDLTDRQLAFSVKDDGSGFDPSRCKGSVDGHFGLEGIRDRVKRLRGDFDIKSSPGNGTYAKVQLSLLADEQEVTHS